MAKNGFDNELDRMINQWLVDNRPMVMVIGTVVVVQAIAMVMAINVNGFGHAKK